jgi:DNA-binding response OmpR family regulator
MKETRIMIVDDDPSIRKFVRANLEARGYKVLLAADGEEALQIIERELPDLILLDIMMPKMDGFTVCRRLREWSKVPILMLTARDNENDKVSCLDAGADDYIIKPFSLRELLSRIKAVLRRSPSDEDKVNTKFQNGGLIVDYIRKIAILNNETLDLTAVEYKILAYLASNAGRVVTSNQILEKVWGEEYSGDYRVLQVNICRLRKKLKDNIKIPSYIQTKPGMGYMVLNSNQEVNNHFT